METDCKDCQQAKKEGGVLCKYHDLQKQKKRAEKVQTLTKYGAKFIMFLAVVVPPFLKKK